MDVCLYASMHQRDTFKEKTLTSSHRDVAFAGIFIYFWVGVSDLGTPASLISSSCIQTRSSIRLSWVHLFL